MTPGRTQILKATADIAKLGTDHRRRAPFLQHAVVLARLAEGKRLRVKAWMAENIGTTSAM
jgi:hypothetical protein